MELGAMRVPTGHRRTMHHVDHLGLDDLLDRLPVLGRGVRPGWPWSTRRTGCSTARPA
ncbi:hypothetical protein O1L60_05145 [Streptomyces diastatochromogenes]|nr:hypothetical protein [Streptomyces diastatochromogenes]